MGASFAKAPRTVVRNMTRVLMAIIADGKVQMGKLRGVRRLEMTRRSGFAHAMVTVSCEMRTRDGHIFDRVDGGQGASIRARALMLGQRKVMSCKRVTSLGSCANGLSYDENHAPWSRLV